MHFDGTAFQWSVCQSICQAGRGPWITLFYTQIWRGPIRSVDVYGCSCATGQQLAADRAAHGCMWRRKQRARRWALTLLGFFAAAAFLGPLLLRSSSNPPAPALASQCAAEFASEWKQYTDSLSGAEAPLCLLSQRGACKSLLPHDLLRNCPPAARFQSCQWLPFSNAIELTVAIGVSSSARLPALVASLLSELEVHAELVFIADATEDTSCIKSVVAILEDLGVTCHICSGSQCDQTLRDTAAAPLLVALHDSITLMHGSLSTLLSTASKLPSSIVSASITAPDKSLAWGIPGSQGLTRVKQLPPLLLVGGKAHMLELPLGRMGRDAYSGRMWQAQGPAWTLSSAVVQRARGGPGLPLLRPMPLRHVLYIDTNLPTPDKDSGSKRTSALMSLMAEAGLAVTFQPLWPTDPKYAAELNAVGVRTLNPSYPPGWAADPTDYAVVFIARRYTYEQCYDAAKRAWPRARIVYDTVDLHFLREARIKMMGAAFNQDTDLQSQGTQEVITWLAESGAPAAEVNTVRQTELRFINQSDVTLVVSDQEVQVVRHYLPAAPVRILSNIMGASSRAAMAGTATDFERRSGFIFVGHMAHYPNQQVFYMLLLTTLMGHAAHTPSRPVHLPWADYSFNYNVSCACCRRCWP